MPRLDAKVCMVRQFRGSGRLTECKPLPSYFRSAKLICTISMMSYQASFSSHLSPGTLPGSWKAKIWKLHVGTTQAPIASSCRDNFGLIYLPIYINLQL